jgi:hypothetical protein
MQKGIWVGVPPQPKKTSLQRKVERLINKAEKQGYEFSNLELSMFKALGKEEWDEEKVNFLVLQQFERLYARFYTK